MGKDLRMEVFASKDIVKSIGLHVYRLHSQKMDNPFSIIRGAARKLRNFNHAGVFEDGKRIYSTDKIEGNIPNADFTIEYEGIQELVVLDNRGVYCELIKYLIKQKLSNVMIYDQYRKYSCKSNITSKWIMTNQGFATFTSKYKEISLERKYNVKVDILNDGKAYLGMSTSSTFTSNLTVFDYMTNGINPIGMEVKNDWAKNNQTGTLTEICDFTVIDKLDFVDSLKAYYIERKEGYRVDKLPDDTKVVKVELQTGNVYPELFTPL